MFWNSKKKENLSEADRIELIREHCSDYISTGEKTQFDITNIDKTGLNEDGEYEFTVTNIARTNYDVTEWADLTECDTDIRKAFQNQATGPSEELELEDTDYWLTKN